MKIQYKSGFKYQLVADVLVDVGRRHAAFTERDIQSQYFVLSRGLLLVREGYAWDGCSGPTWDDPSNMRAGLVHDALYQMLREGLLPASLRKAADVVFHKLLLEDGMGSARAWYYYQAVRMFGADAASAKGSRRVESAGK